MPPKQMGTVWEADPHTLAKIEILSGYLDAWFRVLGATRRGQPLLYVDGFAGPGEYRNPALGSPLAALVAASRARAELGPRWVAGDVHCVFIEPDADRRTNLQQCLAAAGSARGIKVAVLASEFEAGMREVVRRMPVFFTQQYPLFVFIDPFGASDVPFSLVAEVLRSPCSEVLINLDADGAARIFGAKGAADHERLLDRLFGDRSWATTLDHHQPFSAQCRAVLRLYTERLRSVGVGYVYPFEMQGRTGTLNYYLVFASKHPLGLEKMKEAMRQIDGSGAYRFSDARVHQPTLLRFDDPEAYADELFAQFCGTTAGYAALRAFALNQTPFTNPKKMLARLERDDRLAVLGAPATRRKGTFGQPDGWRFVFRSPAP